MVYDRSVVPTGATIGAVMRLPVSGAIALGLCIALAAGCTDGIHLPTEASSDPDLPPPLDAAAAQELFDTFDPADPAALSILAAHRSEQAVLDLAAHELASGATGSVLWAAAFVWVNEGADAEPLVALLAADDAVIRAMAATGLIGRGRPEGFETLFALLTDDTPTPGAPLSQVWVDATIALARFTGIGELGPALDATPAQREAARQRWQAWFDANRDGLTFNREEALWVVA